MLSRARERANAQLAVLADRVDDRLDRLASLGERVSRTPSKPGALPLASPVPSSPAPAPTPSPRPVTDPAAAKAFESVPKAELIALLAKTNSR